ncbi:TPA: conjugal transfer protein TraE, partial [Escherichia coli]
VRMNKEKENWFHTARNLYAKTSVRTVTLRPAQAEYLMTGKILPAELFSIPLLPW